MSPESVKRGRALLNRMVSRHVSDITPLSSFPSYSPFFHLSLFPPQTEGDALARTIDANHVLHYLHQRAFSTCCSFLSSLGYSLRFFHSLFCIPLPRVSRHPEYKAFFGTFGTREEHEMYLDNFLWRRVFFHEHCISKMINFRQTLYDVTVGWGIKLFFFFLFHFYCIRRNHNNEITD